MSQRGPSATTHNTEPATYGLQIPIRSNIAPAAGGPSTRPTAVGRLLEAQRLAAPVGRGVLGDERRDRRRRDPLTDRQQQQGDDQHRPHRGDSHDGQTGDQQPEADGEQPLRAVSLDQPP